MKKLFVVVLLLFGGDIIHAQNFSVQSPSGHNLDYSVINSNSVAVSAYITTDSVAEELVIPDSVSYNNTTYLVRKINGFVTTGISSIIVPNTVITISQYAFNSCSGLSSITIGKSVDTIGRSALANVSLTEINFNAERCEVLWHRQGYSGSYGWDEYSAFGVRLYHATSIFSSGDDTTITNNNIRIINIGEDVRQIPERAFLGCNQLEKINIASSTLSIGFDAFKKCDDIDTVNYYGSPSEWCQINFENEFSNPVLYSRSLYFDTVNATNIVVADSITTISPYAFYNCIGLISLTIGNTITSIGQQAFNGCNILSSITMKCYPPTIYSNTFSGFPVNIPIHVPCGAVSSYMSAANWSNFTHFVEGCATITVTANDFTLGGVTGGGEYSAGDTVTLTAIPFPGSHFVGWSNGTQVNPMSFIATTSANYVAAFAADNLPPDTVFVHDTTYISYTIHDTIIQNIHDTVNNLIHDTIFINNYIHDTLFYPVYIHDTTTVNHIVYDTVYFHDTIYRDRYIHDTIYVHDTIYIQEGEGIDNITLLNAKIYQRNGQIVVEGAEGYPVYLYDVVGRLLATRRETAQEVLLDVPVSGAYLVKIGDAPARRIVVRR